jgi:hypothetical protein
MLTIGDVLCKIYVKYYGITAHARWELYIHPVWAPLASKTGNELQ